MNLPTEWSGYLRRVKEFGGLDRGDTDEIVAAIEYFRDNLGADLKLNEHPIRNYLLLRSVPSLHFLGWLAGELRWFTSQPRSANILSKLKNPGAFHPRLRRLRLLHVFGKLAVSLTLGLSSSYALGWSFGAQHSLPALKRMASRTVRRACGQNHRCLSALSEASDRSVAE